MDVGSSNEIKQLTRKNEHLSQKLAQRENHVEALEVQLSELREQVHLVQQHYQQMQECMRRDSLEKERLQVENAELRRDNTQMAIEIEQLRDQAGALGQERDHQGQ